MVLLIESIPEPAFSFSWEVLAHEIPEAFEPSVRQGILGHFKAGGKLQDWSCQQLRVRVIGGSCHEIDSNEASYCMAAALALMNAVSTANAIGVDPP